MRKRKKLRRERGELVMVKRQTATRTKTSYGAGTGRGAARAAAGPWARRDLLSGQTSRCGWRNMASHHPRSPSDRPFHKPVAAPLDALSLQLPQARDMLPRTTITCLQPSEIIIILGAPCGSLQRRLLCHPHILTIASAADSPQAPAGSARGDRLLSGTCGRCAFFLATLGHLLISVKTSLFRTF